MGERVRIFSPKRGGSLTAAVNSPEREPLPEDVAEGYGSGESRSGLRGRGRTGEPGQGGRSGALVRRTSCLRILHFLSPLPRSPTPATLGTRVRGAGWGGAEALRSEGGALVASASGPWGSWPQTTRVARRELGAIDTPATGTASRTRT